MYDSVGITSSVGRISVAGYHEANQGGSSRGKPGRDPVPTGVDHLSNEGAYPADL